jgi:hypothetical protein
MSNPEKRVVINDDVWSKKLETEYEEYMWNCESMIDGEEPDNFTTLSGEPFCGCSTCYTREQLFFLVPRIIIASQNGQVAVEE